MEHTALHDNRWCRTGAVFVQTRSHQVCRCKEVDEQNCDPQELFLPLEEIAGVLSVLFFRGLSKSCFHEGHFDFELLVSHG